MDGRLVPCAVPNRFGLLLLTVCEQTLSILQRRVHAFHVLLSRQQCLVAQAGCAQHEVRKAGIACLHATLLKQVSAARRVPVAAAWLQVNGQYVPLTKSVDNYWLLQSGGPFTFPTNIKLQSWLGDTVIDRVPNGPVGTFKGMRKMLPRQGLL